MLFRSELERLRLEKELLGFFLSGHPVDTLMGLGSSFDSLTTEDLETLTEKRSFRLCGVVSEIERRFTKKDSKPWARFNLLAKERDFSLPVFTDAYERYGHRLQDGELVVVEGVVSRRDGETRLSVNGILPVDDAISELVEECTWLIDPSSEDAQVFLNDLFEEADRAIGACRVNFALARAEEEDGIVVLTDPRFRIHLNMKQYARWRDHACVRGVRVSIREPEVPIEKRFGRAAF